MKAVVPLFMIDFQLHILIVRDGIMVHIAEIMIIAIDVHISLESHTRSAPLLSKRFGMNNLLLLSRHFRKLPPRV